MILALMLYSLAVTALFATAAAAAEQLLRLSRRPARMVWIVAMLSATGFSAARFQSGLAEPVTVESRAPRTLSNTVGRVLANNGSLASSRYARGALGMTSEGTTGGSLGVTSGRLSASPIQIVSGSAVTRLDRPLVIAWVALSMIGLVIIGLSALRLSRPRRRWTATTVDGVPVLVSHDLGPALIGVLRYRIVLPAWALDLAPGERELILAHEREHANAGDPSLLFLGTLLLALTPWNAPLWWMARRLRFAIELDCDARVLRHRPDPRVYGSLLLDVSARTIGGAMPIAALAEPVSLMERRIAAMTSHLPRFAALRGLAAGVIAAAFVVVACVAPHPASAPAPSTDAKSPMRADSMRASSPASMAMDTARRVAGRDSIPNRAAVDSLRLAIDADLRQQAAMDSTRRTPGSDSVRQGGSRPSRDTATYDQLLARLDSLNRLVEAQRDSVRAARAFRADTALTLTSQAGYRRTYGGGGGAGGAVSGGFGSGGRGGGGGSGGRVASGTAAGATAGSGSIAGVTVINLDPAMRDQFARYNRRIQIVTDTAMEHFPAAFKPHEGELDLIVLAFDSTGALTRSGIKVRPSRTPGESLRDRDVLRLVMPDVSIESFREWGLADISGKQQARASGVTVMYAFTGRAPW